VPITIALVLLALASGCAPRSTAPRPSPDQPHATSAPGPATTTPSALADLAIELRPLASGFELPLFMAEAPDDSGRMLVVEQGGRIRLARDGRPGDTWLDVSDRISTGGERGLLGLAFSADFAESGRVYLDYTEKGTGDTRVVELVADDPASDSPHWSQPRVLLAVKQPYANHNGGCIAFAPDGKLVVGMGDGGGAGDPHGNAQNPNSLLGKILKLDVATGKVEVWQSGVRNPWRYSFDRANGDLWIGDVGQNLWEEIDYAPAGTQDGRDWGWNRWEGRHTYPPGTRRSKGGFSFPVVEYGHGLGEAVTGGYVYRGSNFPQLVGTYFYGDYGSGFIGGVRTTDPSGGRLRTAQGRVLLSSTGLNISSFAEDAAGELYVIDYGGSIYRLAPAR
jgi:glucose/arabinose dehydrogenase